MQNQLFDNFIGYPLKHFNIKTLRIKSKTLKNNPLSDPCERFIPFLTPKGGEVKRIIYILAGFSGVSSKYFNIKFKEDNLPQLLDKIVARKQAPNCAYVFVDTITYWGGSQFIDSKGTGKYENFFIKELLPEVEKQIGEFKAKDRCVFGGSSGGYGALHLTSKYPDLFSYAVAIAPDSFFKLSLLPEIYSAMPLLEQFKGVKGIKKEIEAGRFLNRRDAFTVLNAIGMGTCYAPHPKKKGEVEWPIDSHTGELNAKVWKKWTSHDPVEFLKKRKENVKKLKGIYLDVGTRDQYYLQYGTRQIHTLLKSIGAKSHYSEFNGNHYDISERRPQAYSWLIKHGF